MNEFKDNLIKKKKIIRKNWEDSKNSNLPQSFEALKIEVLKRLFQFSLFAFPSGLTERLRTVSRKTKRDLFFTLLVPARAAFVPFSFP